MYYPWLEKFYPGAKVIVCVRDLRAIVASMEKLYRKNAHLNDPADIPSQMNFVTVDQRVGHWMSSPPVGLALSRLKNAFETGDARKFFFLVYEEFVVEPKRVMDALYRYIDVEPFEHNFKGVEQVVSENDGVHGVYGDHTIRPVVLSVEPDWDHVLGSQISDALVTRNQWFYTAFYGK